MARIYRTDADGHAYYKEIGNWKATGINMRWFSACGDYYMNRISSSSPKSTQENTSCPLCKKIIALGATND